MLSLAVELRYHRIPHDFDEMLPTIYFVIIGFFILIHGAFKPSSTITMFSSHVIIYLLYCFWGVPSLHEAFTSILFAAFIHWISLKSCLIYYVKMWIFYAFISATCAAFLPYLIVRPFDEDNITCANLIFLHKLIMYLK